MMTTGKRNFMHCSWLKARAADERWRAPGHAAAIQKERGAHSLRRPSLGLDCAPVRGAMRAPWTGRAPQGAVARRKDNGQRNSAAAHGKLALARPCATL